MHSFLAKIMFLRQPSPFFLIDFRLIRCHNQFHNKCKIILKVKHVVLIFQLTTKLQNKTKPINLVACCDLVPTKSVYMFLQIKYQPNIHQQRWYDMMREDCNFHRNQTLGGRTDHLFVYFWLEFVIWIVAIF